MIVISSNKQEQSSTHVSWHVQMTAHADATWHCFVHAI